MRSSDLPKTITPARLRSLAETYASHIPPKLQPLETFRTTELPRAIRARSSTKTSSTSTSSSSSKKEGSKPKSEGAHITHPEHCKLVEYKLRREKWRPTLAAMARDLPAAQVVDVSRRAFAAYDGDEGAGTGVQDDDKDKDKDIDKDRDRGKKGKKANSTEAETEASSDQDRRRERALTILTELRGVGPATASLLLSVYDPANVPFFSDELFIWLSTRNGVKSGEESGEDNGEGGEKDVGLWRGSMKYNVKEYAALCGWLGELRARLEREYGGDVDAQTVEHAAYAIVKGLETSGEKDTTTAEEVVDTKATTAKKRQAPVEKSEADDASADGSTEQSTGRSMRKRKK